MARAEAPRTMNPTKVFAVLAGIVIAVAGVVYLTRDDPAPTPTETTQPDFSLTDPEAIARVEELDLLKQRAYRTVDQSLLRTIFTTDSPSLPLVERDFERLQRSGIKFLSTFQTEELHVVLNESDKIVVEQTVVVTPRLLDSTGRDVTDSGPQRQVVNWVLQRSTDVWLIHRTVVQEVTHLK